MTENRTRRSTRSGTTCSWTPRRASGPSCSGVAPNRRFVIEWRNVHFFGDTTRRIDVNVVLHENGRDRDASTATSPTTGGSAATRPRSGSRTRPETVGLRYSVQPAVPPTRAGGQLDPVPAARLARADPRRVSTARAPRERGPRSLLLSALVQATKRLSTRSGTSSCSQPPTSTKVRTLPAEPVAGDHRAPRGHDVVAALECRDRRGRYSRAPASATAPHASAGPSVPRGRPRTAAGPHVSV